MRVGPVRAFFGVALRRHPERGDAIEIVAKGRWWGIDYPPSAEVVFPRICRRTTSRRWGCRPRRGPRRRSRCGAWRWPGGWHRSRRDCRYGRWRESRGRGLEISGGHSDLSGRRWRGRGSGKLRCCGRSTAANNQEGCHRYAGHEKGLPRSDVKPHSMRSHAYRPCRFRGSRYDSASEHSGPPLPMKLFLSDETSTCKESKARGRVCAFGFGSASILREVTKRERLSNVS